VFRIYRDVRFSKDPTPYKVCHQLLRLCDDRTDLGSLIFRQHGIFVRSSQQVVPLTVLIGLALDAKALMRVIMFNLLLMVEALLVRAIALDGLSVEQD
jgi:hypothetical protein